MEAKTSRPSPPPARRLGEMEGVGARRRSEPTRHPRVDQTARPPRQMSCCNLARLFVGGAFCWVRPELGPILARRMWWRSFSEPPRLGVRAASPRRLNLPRASLHLPIANQSRATKARRVRVFPTTRDRGPGRPLRIGVGASFRQPHHPPLPWSGPPTFELEKCVRRPASVGAPKTFLRNWTAPRL